MKLDFSNLSAEQIETINQYCREEMKELKKICNPIIISMEIPQMFHDDMYCVAIDVLCDSVKRYDTERECTFVTFLTGNIKRKFIIWNRDRCREKRCNKVPVYGKDHEVKRDESGEVIYTIIPDLSFDMVSGDDEIDLKDKVSSGYDVLNDVIQREYDNSNDTVLKKAIEKIEKSEKLSTFFQNISKKGRVIAEYIIEGYTQDEIQDVLHITQSEYLAAMKEFRMHNNIVILLGGK